MLVSLTRDSSSLLVNSSIKDQSASLLSIPSNFSIHDLNSGSFSNSCLPMPHHCGPCPEKINTILSFTSLARPSETSVMESPSRYVCRFDANSSLDSATIANRIACWDCLTALVKQMSLKLEVLSLSFKKSIYFSVSSDNAS